MEEDRASVVGMSAAAPVRDADGARDVRVASPTTEQGSMLAIVGFLGALIIVATLLMGGLTHRVVDRSRAQAAADAAALAGVADGRSAASAIAAANGAQLREFEDHGNEVRVEVRTFDGAVAHARAERRLVGFDGG